MADEEQLRLDLGELRHLESVAKRPRVASLLGAEIRNIEAKIYVFLEGVDEEKMETLFKPMSVDIKFHDIQGKNYRCAISKLNKEIVPEKCKVAIKPTKIIITLFKASKGNWLDLYFKEDKLKQSPDKDRDPMAGIMDLMKVWSFFPEMDLKHFISR
ncbi:hypothetical protein GW17_00038864 [Ensete ventricosum]|nr:hypothetical protein GW17_00038864 [Ensete ventricosum]